MTALAMGMAFRIQRSGAYSRTQFSDDIVVLADNSEAMGGSCVHDAPQD
jgi:hypothetical protein